MFCNLVTQELDEGGEKGDKMKRKTQPTYKSIRHTLKCPAGEIEREKDS